VLTAAGFTSCGAAAPGAASAELGLPLVVPAPRDDALLARARVAAPMPPDPGEELPPCPLRWSPRALEASVVTIPADLATRMMKPLYAAICACTRPGQRVAVVARMIPEHGEVTAKTSERRDDSSVVASPPIDACLAKRLGSGLYEPFRVGSDNLGCAPVRPRARAAGAPAPFDLPRPACAPQGDAFTTIVYPVYVDR
jgi:hypothetical protein